METFYLQIEVQKEQTELLEGQRSGYEDDYPTEQEVRTAAPNTLSINSSFTFFINEIRYHKRRSHIFSRYL